MKINSSMRRVFSMMLVLVLVLSLAPVTFAASAKTIYFENTADWSTVNIYYWSDSNTGFVAWPGKSMTLSQGKIYTYDLPEGVQYVIFNNGSTQTADLTLPSDMNMYSYDTGAWSQFGCAHVWAGETVITAATCTEPGAASYTCDLCGETKTSELKPLGHSFSGNRCSRCGVAQTVVYFDLTGSGWSTPYVYAWSASGTHCGEWPGTPMTPVAGVPGLYSYGFDEAPENVIFNNGNGGEGNQTADLKRPTDDKNLYTYSTGAWSEYNSCDHSWDEGKVTVEATCVVNGTKVYTCTLCGDERIETIVAPGHNFVNGACNVCGAPASCTSHVWDEGVVTTEPGCWTFGFKSYTCTVCGETKSETLYPGHDTYIDEVIDPTCTATGKEIIKCTRCAYKYDRTLPRVDHSYVEGDIVPPTCTEDGYTVLTCSGCGAQSSGNFVYHTGHSWNGNTCTSCSAVCNHTYQNGICTACSKGGPAYVEGYYEIATAPQLFWFAAQVNSGNGGINGKLVADIDLNGSKWTAIGYYLSDTLSPDTVPYTGTFDGQGHTVSNFVSAGTDNEGLFGYCSSATIMNLGVINATVTGWRAGAVAGYALTSNVLNCYAKDCTIIGKTSNSVAELSGTVYIAPVASPQGGIIRNCYALDCTLSGNTTLEVYATPVGGTDTQNGYYCGVTYSSDFDSVRNSTEVTMAQLRSGEVTYALNKGVTDGTQGWYQTCGTGLPAHSGQTVYLVDGCGSENDAYTNDPDMVGTHVYDTGRVTTAPGCVTTGIKTFTCVGCGHSYTETIAATGHSYKDGTCTGCGKADPDYVPTVTQPTLSLKYPALTFEDVITMNVFFEASGLESVVEMGLITYKSQVAEWNIDNAEAVIPGYELDPSGLFVASSEGIAAKDMGDTYWFAVYAKLTDGSCTYTKLVSYSPTTYAYNQLGDPAMSKMVIAMLNYGAAAQVYFNHNTDNLMNKKLTADQLASIETYRADMIDGISTITDEKSANFTKTTTGFTKRYPTITFEGAFSIDYLCQPSAAPAGDITLYYWDQAAFDAADVLTVDNATGALTLEATGDLYATAVEGIAAKDLDKGIYVSFVYSDGTNTYCSGILGYSIGMYCQGLASGSDAMAPFAAATAVYGYYAKQTFNT